MKAKVFGIGFQKSGTTTLGVMLTALGYRVAGYYDFRDMADQSELNWPQIESRALQVMADHDAAKDTPWPLLYQSLDQHFPNGKFIHVTRDPQAWIASAVKDFADYPNALHQLIYGVPYPKGHEQIWLDRYNRHNDEVAAYFAHRPDDYLHLRLEGGLSYERICPFLNEPLIATGSPQANTRLNKKLKMAWWRIKDKVMPD